MAILFAAGEIESFSGTPLRIDTTAARHRSGYARSSICTSYAGPVQARLSMGPTFSLQCQLYLVSTSTGGRAIEFKRGGTSGIRLFLSSNTQDGVFFTNSGGASTQLISFGSGGAVPTDRLVRLRMEITLHASAGSVAVYVDEERLGQISGVDTIGNLGGNSYDEVEFKAHFTSGREMNVSELFITDGADPQLSRWGLVTLVPASAGALQEWTGSVGAINLTSTGASNIVSASAGEFFTFAHSELFTGDSKSIKAVILNARHALDGSGPSRLRAVQQIGGTVYEAASAGASAAASLVAVMASSLDGRPWYASTINASQFGWQSVA